MLKAMIVDDDVNVAACLRALIPWTKLGYEVVAEAVNGADGLKKLKQSRPDVVITDLKMPVMDGAEFCLRIREVSDDTAIIFLSAYESFATAQLALRCGVTEYILKPINSKKLELLAGVLDDLAKSFYNREFFHRLINSEETACELGERMRRGDAAYFERFFAEFADCAASDFSTVQAASGKLIFLLFDCLRDMGVDEADRRNEALAELRLLQRKMDMVTYTSKLFFGLLRLTPDGDADHNRLTMERIKSYIEENIADPDLSVVMVADQFHFSADYLSKLFSRYGGMSASAYLAKVRLKKAMKLLKDTDAPINDIAEQTGYSNSNYFARVFKKQMNQTPTEYRDRARRLGGACPADNTGGQA